MKATGIVIAALFVVAGVCQADSGDDTLQLFLSKSDLVVLGTIVTEPEVIFSEKGVPNHLCEFKVAEVCKGDAGLKGKTIRINIQRFESDKKDRHPLIKKDGECILFLKKEAPGTVPSWVTADFWFGVQHPFTSMVKSLKRLGMG